MSVDAFIGTFCKREEVSCSQKGPTTKSQLRRSNGTDEQRFVCYANGRRARVPGGTTLGPRHARRSGYSRTSQEASALPAARGSKQQEGRVYVTPITVVASIDPKLLENQIGMDKFDADSGDDSTDESVMEFLESTQERDTSVTADFVRAEVWRE
jgi:hypothetical protein